MKRALQRSHRLGRHALAEADALAAGGAQLDAAGAVQQAALRVVGRLLLQCCPEALSPRQVAELAGGHDLLAHCKPLLVFKGIDAWRHAHAHRPSPRLRHLAQKGARQRWRTRPDRLPHVAALQARGEAPREGLRKHFAEHHNVCTKLRAPRRGAAAGAERLDELERRRGRQPPVAVGAVCGVLGVAWRERGHRGRHRLYVTCARGDRGPRRRETAPLLSLLSGLHLSEHLQGQGTAVLARA